MQILRKYLGYMEQKDRINVKHNRIIKNNRHKSLTNELYLSPDLLIIF